MLQTVKKLVHHLVIATNQYTTNHNQATTPFTNNYSNSIPTHSQTSTIHPSYQLVPDQQSSITNPASIIYRIRRCYPTVSNQLNTSNIPIIKKLNPSTILNSTPITSEYPIHQQHNKNSIPIQKSTNKTAPLSSHIQLTLFNLTSIVPTLPLMINYKP